MTHMAREIAEIPDAAARFLVGNAEALVRIGAAIRALDPSLIVTVARGSSDHAATYLKYAAELAAGVPVASVGPSVASVYGRALRLDRAVCIAISQSGQSPDIVAMLASARSSGALSIAITNAPGSPLAMAADHCLPLLAGPETSVAATKSFASSVLAALALIAEWREDSALRAAVQALPAAFGAALSLDWSPLAARLARAQSAYVLGRGPGFAIAAETALKLKETCALHAEAHSAAEVLHGPSALARDAFPVLALTVQDAARDGVLATARRLRGQGADVFVTSEDLPVVAPLHPLVDPLVLAVTFYALAEGLARRRGLDPDAPQHLRKVTETQ